MIRTIISLDEESKKWLDQQAREENISAAEIWERGDGLRYQSRLRKEWEK